MTMPLISVDDVAVHYGTTVAVDDFSLDVAEGSLVALVGPSGCGKTTLLRAIAGFEQPTRGTITIRDAVVTDTATNTMVAPERRNVGMVFQDFALFPHISVAENVGYGVPGANRVRRVEEVLGLVGLSDHGDRFPHELSGGEQQRVALARALAPEPEVVLLDEPFSSLDAPQREKMRRELRKILKAARVTAILVTHDQAEALAIADVIAVMRDGRILQTGEPDEVYGSPSTPWVAKFLGDAVLLQGSADNGSVMTLLGPIPTDLPDGSAAQVMVRPEWISPTINPEASNCVADREFYGHDQRLEIEVNSGEIVEALVPTRTKIQVGDRVDLELVDAIVYPLNG